MFILASKNSSQQGAYAVENQNGENVLFFFEEEDDADRYAVIKPEDIVIPPNKLDDNFSKD